MIKSINSFEGQSQEDIFRELMHVCKILQNLLPDPTLSPLERIERLARIIPYSIQRSSEHLTARTKLNQIRNRLHELLPDVSISIEEKINILVLKVNELVPEITSKFFEKLEFIGDHRIADNGRVPYPNWVEADLCIERKVQEKRRIATKLGV